MKCENINCAHNKTCSRVPDDNVVYNYLGSFDGHL